MGFVDGSVTVGGTTFENGTADPFLNAANYLGIDGTTNVTKFVKDQIDTLNNPTTGMITTWGTDAQNIINRLETVQLQIPADMAPELPVLEFEFDYDFEPTIEEWGRQNLRTILLAMHRNTLVTPVSPYLRFQVSARVTQPSTFRRRQITTPRPTPVCRRKLLRLNFRTHRCCWSRISRCSAPSICRMLRRSRFRNLPLPTLNLIRSPRWSHWNGRSPITPPKSSTRR